MVVAAVVVAIACLWLFIYTLWCAASQKLLMRRVAANNQVRPTGTVDECGENSDICGRGGDSALSCYDYRGPSGWAVTC